MWSTAQQHYILSKKILKEPELSSGVAAVDADWEKHLAATRQ